jgi:Raf kinase inhibitor-like YbhB/YbcL family protein
MKLESPAFGHNQAIPSKYTCDDENISPALKWSDAPENTESFALIVDDPDAPSKVWVYWIVFNIPSTVEYLTENIKPYSAKNHDKTEGPLMLGATDFNGLQKWGGPCPPSGTHRYRFTLYALDTMLDLVPGATKEQLLEAMQGNILEKTTLIGTYQRKNN